MEKLRHGRFSFKGFNPEVEELMNEFAGERDTAEEEDADVSAREILDVKISTNQREGKGKKRSQPAEKSTEAPTEAISGRKKRIFQKPDD